MSSTKNIIVGAATLYTSVQDSTMDEWYEGNTGGVDTAGGPSLPDNVAFGASATSRPSFSKALDASDDWRSLGLTSGGVQLTYSPDYGEVEVDQILDAAKMFKQKMSFSVKTSLAEATLENLLLAWGQGADTLGVGGPASGTVTDDGDEPTTDEDLDEAEAENKYLGISSGGLGDEPVERALAFVGLAPRTASGKKAERIYHLRRALQVESAETSLARSEATMVPCSFRCLPDPAFEKEEYGKLVDRVLTRTV